MHDGGRKRAMGASALAASVGLAAQMLYAGAAAAASFTEFQVNTYTDAIYQRRPAICAGAENFVVAWSDDREFYREVFGQRIDRFGSALGGEFRVNSLHEILVSDESQAPKAACDAAGGFVVVWVDGYHDSSGSAAVIARRFDSLANPLGADFVVSSYTENYQGTNNTAVAMDQVGNFVVAWDDQYRAGDYPGVFAQRFDGSGARIGTEFQVNTHTGLDQGGSHTDIAAAVDAAGNFVVVWGEYERDGGEYGVFGQRFGSDGARLDGEFLVNTQTLGYQGNNIAAAADLNGGFVVVWTGATDGDGDGVFGQRFASSGVRIGTEFQVNSHVSGEPTAYNYGNVSLALDPEGGFVVVWDHEQDLDGEYGGVFGRQFSSSGNPIGDQFQVNSYTMGNQYQPVIAANASGDFVVAWHDYSHHDGYGGGIFGGALTNCPSSPLAPCANPTKSLFSLKRVIGNPSQSKMIWKWIKGTATSFGDPTDDTSYALCVYDDSRLVLDYDVDAGAPWTLAGSGYKFDSPTGNASGITKIKLKPGTGKAKAIVKGGLDFLELPSGDPMFTQATEVRVQLVRTDTEQCWQGVFPAGAIENTTGKFKDKS